MKIITSLLTLLTLFASSSTFALEKNEQKITDKKLDDEPCTCVFNKNRMWNPEKILWNNQEWECTDYKEDGTCAQVNLVKNGVTAPCSKKDILLKCVFNNTKSSRLTINVNGEIWECIHYNDTGTCEGIQRVKKLESAEVIDE